MNLCRYCEPEGCPREDCTPYVFQDIRLGRWQAKCPNCGFSEATFRTEAEARADWNLLNSVDEMAAALEHARRTLACICDAIQNPGVEDIEYERALYGLEQVEAAQAIAKGESAEVSAMSIAVYETPEAAHEAYCEAAQEYCGEYANAGPSSATQEHCQSCGSEFPPVIDLLSDGPEPDGIDCVPADVCEGCGAVWK